MANRIQVRRGSGAPGIETSEESGLKPYELGFDYTNSALYIYNAQKGTIVHLGGSSGSSVTYPIAMTLGGTGATSGREGIKNLFAAGRTTLSSYQYGTSLPDGKEDGDFFLLEEESTINELKTQIINGLFPVGSFYFTTSSTNPGTLAGWTGTWTQQTGVSVTGLSGLYCWKRTA